MKKTKVLFVCIHNSARSQMAEAFLNALGEGDFEAESAGLEPGTLNPLVVEVMGEAGFDLSRNRTKGVFDLFKQGRRYHYVITVCDESSAERCPIFPGNAKRLHWSFRDPSSLEGGYEKRREETRKIRDTIRDKIRSWIEEWRNDPQ
ncbi:MAG: arsenate reductase ArsC [Alphaproteobacteria bacterium]|uniref:Arsenate reductase ArsC n=1 Tax=Candidatus Nitrobium versatile TaxID=2884831 RepID=A0A953M3U7_9BACT|nr:arsenate reductase ArsC [Candidatus Nitrobium versatile]